MEISLAKRRVSGRFWPEIRTALNPKAVIGGAIVLLVLVCALLPNQLAPYPASKQSLVNRLQAPVFVEGGTINHLLGTDQLGRDILSRLIYAARISLLVASASVLFAGLVGSLAGLFAGYYGGWFDMLVMRLTDVQLSVPPLVLALALVAVMGPGIDKVVLALSLSSWPQYSRVIRGQVMAIRETEYILAARTVGASDRRIVLHHLLPNVLAPLIILATVGAARMILAEASLSYLGVGVQPPAVSWGLMVLDGRDVLNVAWWVAIVPGSVIMLTVLGLNLLGDFLRELLDPRRRGRTG
jgi:peptide/nickel transport system permease protein